MPIKLCVALMRGSTRRLPRNKRDGNEATQRTPGFVKRSDKQTSVASKLHETLIKPRPNGTLALPPSDKLPMTFKGPTMHRNQHVLQASPERFGDDFRCCPSRRLRFTPRRGEVPRCLPKVR